jgi:prolyl oligopeptidase
VLKHQTRYPQAARQSIVDRLHGREIPDPYRWLEDPNTPESRAWQAAQDLLWFQYVTDLPDRDRLRSRIAELTGVGMVTAPLWRGERQFFLRRTVADDHPILYAADPDGTESVLVDPVALDPGGTTTLDHWQPDPSGRLLAYQVSRGGTEESELFVIDVATGQVVDGPIDRCRYSPVAWLPDRRSFYYVHAGQVRRHRIGVPDDETLLEATGSYGLEISDDGRWLTISAPRGATNDLWLADLADPAGPAGCRLRQVRHGARTALAVRPDGRMLVLTTLDAPNGRICVGDPASPDAEHWRELVPEDPEAPITDVAFLDDLMLVGRSRHTVGEIAIHDLSTGERTGEVPMPGLGSVGTMTVLPGGGRQAWFSYTDSVTPPTIYRYDADTNRTTLWRNSPGTVSIPDVESRQVTYRSADGTQIRMLILTRSGSGTGPRPAILYGYGGFGIPLTPAYSSFTLAWVEAGGIFVTVNLRGGGEYGDGWHRAGMLSNKQRVFDDFIAAAERLIADGWTTPEQLCICGESNGGLLVGAALTQRPDLFAAATCSAPLLDMVRYPRSGLGPNWISEYGNPDDPDELDWLLGYSPYHHVRAGVEYPAVLFTVFGGDTRVDPMHARKMCAALQHANPDGRPILLRHEEDRGHSGTAMSRGVGLAADILAFFADRTGLG